MSEQAAKERCYQYRKRILDLSQNIYALHIAPSFSCLEIVDTLYYDVMKREGKNDFKDTFILSKGHGAPAQYVVLESLDILEKKDIDQLCTAEGRLGSHPDYGIPGIHASTGSLGHGPAMAVGIAVAEKAKNNQNKTYVVISDGELQEGSTWEAVMLAPSLNLDNLVICVDLNDFQSFARMSESHPNMYPVASKFESFGWHAVEVDGHSNSELIEAFNTPTNGKPLAVIAKTVKGKGVSFMENVPIWHFRSPNPEEYQTALKDIEKMRN